MKKIIYVLGFIIVVNLIILDIVVLKLNNSFKTIHNEVFKDKINVNANELVCTGTFINKSDDKSNKYYIYDTKKNNFEIIYGDGTGNAIGTYTINDGNELKVVYKGTILNKTTNTYELGDIEIKVLQNKDCSAIYIDDIAYTKIND